PAADFDHHDQPQSKSLRNGSDVVDSSRDASQTGSERLFICTKYRSRPSPASNLKRPSSPLVLVPPIPSSAGTKKFCGRPSSGYVRVPSSESATITMNPRFMSYKGVSNSGRAMRPG